jgi:hypothetical protein
MGGHESQGRYASDVTEAPDSRIENQDLDGATEAVELREALERMKKLSSMEFYIYNKHLQVSCRAYR